MSETQTKISKILDEIIKNEEVEVEQYYGIIINVYRNIDKYLQQLDTLEDKIYLAQWCNNYNKVKELVETLSLDDYKKNKYNKLKSKNSELDETINFKLLSEKYEFLDKIIDMITTDVDIQDQILSLSDSRLKLFEMMYEKLQSFTDYYNPYISAILQRIGYVSLENSWKNDFHIYDELLTEVDNLISKGYQLSDDEINILLYLCTSPVQHSIPNYEEMRNFGNSNTIDNVELNEIITKAKENKNLEHLKFAILVQSYGIVLECA